MIQENVFPRTRNSLFYSLNFLRVELQEPALTDQQTETDGMFLVVSRISA